MHIILLCWCFPILVDLRDSLSYHSGLLHCHWRNRTITVWDVCNIEPVVLPVYEIPSWRCDDRLISIMGFPILVRRHLYIESRSWIKIQPNQNKVQPFQWRHNERDGVSNHRRLDALLNRLFRRLSKKKIKTPRHWPLWGEITDDRWIPLTKGQ